MDSDEFKEKAEEMIDYIVQYFETLSEKRVTPNSSFGYLKPLLPSSAPETGEPFQKIMEDFEKYIMPGITHWQHPKFHACLPTCTSYPTILSSMLLDVIGCIGFNWSISCCGKDLEQLVVNWLVQMMDLPDSFLTHGTTAGGLIQGDPQDCILVCMLAARNHAFKTIFKDNPTISTTVKLASLVAYCSDEAYPNIKKSAYVSLINLRVLETDSDLRLRGETLLENIKNDVDIGLYPFFVNVGVGNASCGTCDAIDEIGPICEKYKLWLHVDGYYAGAAMICPEHREALKGMEYASSIAINACKWMLVNIDCSVLFVKNNFDVSEALILDKTTFSYNGSEEDWKCKSNRAFRAFKLWMVIQSYGVEGLQAYIRNHIRLAKLFAEYVRKDDRFEVISCNFGLVCFRLKGSDTLNTALLNSIIASGRMHLISCHVRSKRVIRFVLSREDACEDDIRSSWEIIQEHAEEVLRGST